VYRPFLQAKIFPVKVTDKNLEYEGSLALSGALIRKAGLEPGQMVLVVNLENGKRFETYLIDAAAGACSLNGATARLGEIGDRLIVMAVCYLEPGEKIIPVIVKVDGQNVTVEKS
jgi:aspartate 1-decarboxylase